MDREEAIAYGNDYYIDLVSSCCEVDEKHKEFVRMSLKALEQQPCEDEELDFVQPHKKIKVNLMPCDDAISRREVLDVIEREEFKGDAISEIEKLQSVKLQETCEDAISRRAVMDCFKKWQPYMPTMILWDFEKELSTLPSVSTETPNRCEDAISKQEVLDEINRIGVKAFETYNDYSELFDFIDSLPSASTEKTDDYRQGWHDAIDKALNEAYTIHHYGDIFRVVQEETLVGLGMAYEQVSTEKTGRWIIVDDCEQFIAKCSECGRIEDSRRINKYPYCHCGARMGVEE